MVTYNLERSSYVLISQKLLGQFSSPVLNVLYTFIILLIGFILLLGESIGCLNRTNIQERVEILFNIGAVLFLVFMYLAIRWKFNNLLAFVTFISKPTSVNDDLRCAALQLTTERAALLIPKLATTFACFLSMAVFSWCAMPLFIEFDYDNKNFYLGPFLYQCTDTGENRFPLEFLCLNMNTPYKYIAVNTFHTLVVVWGCIVYAWAFIFFICIRIFVEANRTVLTERLLQMQERVSLRVLKQFCSSRNDLDGSLSKLKITRETAMIEELVKIIIYYQYLHRSLKLIIPVLQAITNVMLIFYCILASLSAFLIVNETKSTGYLMFRMKIGGVILNATLAAFVFTYCSETISSMHRTIMDAIYFLPWYSQTIRFQKLLYQFQFHLQKSFRILAFGMYITNLNMFASVVRLTYSALNLMLAKFGRNQ